MIRRSFLKHLVAVPLVATAAPSTFGASTTKLKILMKSAWGSDDPTKAAFPFLHGDALSEAGHEVQIFLLGEAVSLMRKSVANAVVPVGWPPLSEALTKIAGKKIPIYACGACSRARGVTDADLTEYGAKFGNPKIFRFTGRVVGQNNYRVGRLLLRLRQANDAAHLLRSGHRCESICCAMLDHVAAQWHAVRYSILRPGNNGERHWLCLPLPGHAASP